MLVKLFTALIRPTVEYGKSVWGPAFILGQRKIEKIQWRTTCCLSELVIRSYDKKLCELQLPSLAHRRLRGDLILLFKVVNNS